MAEKQSRERAEQKEDTDEKEQKKHNGRTVNMQDPMFIWIGLLLVAVVVKIILSTSGLVPSSSVAYSWLNAIPNFLLQFPGIVVLPLIAGAIIGAEVGAMSSSPSKALKHGLLNGIYASVIYVVAIVVIYIVINYFTPQAMPVLMILIDNIVVPIAVMIIVLEAFAVLSYSRKVEED